MADNFCNFRFVRYKDGYTNIYGQYVFGEYYALYRGIKLVTASILSSTPSIIEHNSFAKHVSENYYIKFKVNNFAYTIYSNEQVMHIIDQIEEVTMLLTRDIESNTRNDSEADLYSKIIDSSHSDCRHHALFDGDPDYTFISYIAELTIEV